MEKELSVNEIVEQQANQNKENSEKQAAEEKEKIPPEEGAGGKEKEEQDKQKEDEVPNPVADLLKKYGFATVEELDAKLKEEKKEEKELTPEEKAKQQEIYEAELHAYSVKNGKMSLSDISKLGELKKAQDRDVIFEKFKKEFKEDNPDIAEEQFDAELNQAFEDEYKLSSKNEKTKLRGETRLAKEAKEVRSPLEQVYERTKGEYDEEAAIRKTYPEFAKKVETVSSEIIPEKYDFFKKKDGDEEVPVEIPISAEDKKTIAAQLTKEMQTPEVFEMYQKGNIDGINSLSKSRLESILWTKYKDQGLEEVSQKFETRGFAKGQVGSKNSFALNQEKNVDQANKLKKGEEARQEVLDNLQGK